MIIKEKGKGMYWCTSSPQLTEWFWSGSKLWTKKHTQGEGRHSKVTGCALSDRKKMTFIQKRRPLSSTALISEINLCQKYVNKAFQKIWLFLAAFFDHPYGCVSMGGAIVTFWTLSGFPSVHSLPLRTGWVRELGCRQVSSWKLWGTGNKSWLLANPTEEEGFQRTE